MADTDRFASIADATKPNAGRIYDFMLGGNHNFEVDRLAAQQILKLAPFFPKLARTIRWFLGEAVQQLSEKGFTHFLDFASGLPTVDHIHLVAPSKTKVAYSDLDPVTVAYGQEIIKDNPDVRYAVCNAAKPENLLNTPVVTQLFGAQRKVAIGFNGIAWFLKDEEVGHAMKTLYDWAGPGSCLFLSDSGFDITRANPAMLEGLKLYEKMGQPFIMRSLDSLKELIRPWKVREPGFRPLEEWIKLKGGVAEETQASYGLSFLGVILEK